jgi:hypothetical protein
MFLEKAQQGIGNPFQTVMAEALSVLAQFEVRKREERGKLGLFDLQRWRKKRQNPREIPGDLLVVASTLVAVIFLAAYVPHAGIQTIETTLTKPSLPSKESNAQLLNQPSEAPLPLVFFEPATATPVVSESLAPMVELPWALPNNAPEHVKQWEAYIDTIVEANYSTNAYLFEQFGLTKQQMKHVMSAFIGYENGQLTPSPTNDYGPLQINIVNFEAWEDPSNLMTQGQKAHSVFAAGLLQTGSLEGAMGYYNGGNNGPHEDYVPCVRALYELMTNPHMFERYHVVTSGETLSQIAERYGVSYGRFKQFRYNESSRTFELVELENYNQIRTGMALVIQ